MVMYSFLRLRHYVSLYHFDWGLRVGLFLVHSSPQSGSNGHMRPLLIHNGHLM
jgi:hypothetical protein